MQLGLQMLFANHVGYSGADMYKKDLQLAIEADARELRSTEEIDAINLEASANLAGTPAEIVEMLGKRRKLRGDFNVSVDPRATELPYVDAFAAQTLRRQGAPRRQVPKRQAGGCRGTVTEGIDNLKELFSERLGMPVLLSS